MQKKSILIIEDDVEVCTLYKYLLEKEGYIIHEAHTGREALIAVGLERPTQTESAPLMPIKPDLIVLDVMLPETDGYTILSRFLQHEALSKIPVIIITAKSQMLDLFVSASNVKHFFSKPFDPKLVRQKIKQIIG